SLTTYKPEFLSEEFGDFIELLTRWNLSDTCSSDILKFACKALYHKGQKIYCEQYNGKW
ncbi:6757_t:CDS:2, partial [Funneliformis mosseae]